MDKAELIYLLLNQSSKKELSLLSSNVKKNTIHIYLNNNGLESCKGLIKKTHGHDMDFSQALLVFLALIPAIDSSLNIIKKLKNSGVSPSIVQEIKNIAIKTLDISKDKWEEAQNAIDKWVK